MGTIYMSRRKLTSRGVLSLSVIAGLALSTVGLGTVAASANGCSLPGLGTEESPWLVNDRDDFLQVGDICAPDGHYRQTANFSVDTNVSNTRVDALFSGVYDGDHYTITFTGESYQGRRPLFMQVGVRVDNGVTSVGLIKKLRLNGKIMSTRSEVSSLVRYLEGGIISEVGSTVHIQVRDSNPRIGGLVAVSRNGNGLIQYSTYAGRIDWIDPGTRTEGPTIGGLVGAAEPMYTEGGSNPPTAPTGISARTLEIRDSYAQPVVSFNSGDIDSTSFDFVNSEFSRVFLGGVVGADGLYDVTIDSQQDITDAGVTPVGLTQGDSNLRLVRTYAAGSFTNTCDGDADTCRTSKISTGGLVGYSTNTGTGDVYVSNFWLSGMGPNAIGLIRSGQGSQPSKYSNGLPVAVPLSSNPLKLITTYQTKEDPSEANTPSGTDFLTEAATLGGALGEQDYRWAIEPSTASVEGFVPSKETTFFTIGVWDRELWYNSPIPSQTYRTRQVVQTVVDYPKLGRVWEICQNINNGYPSLVWQEFDGCSDGSGGDGVGNPTASKTKPVDEAAAALAAGLTGAELQAFLASGLTLEEWLARRLAQTGTPAGTLQMALLASGALAVLGAWFVTWSNRRRQTA